MKYLSILIIMLMTSCLAADIELAPGQEVLLYKKKFPLIYKKVTVAAIEDYTAKNLAEHQDKAITRIEWGLGILLVGTIASAALKSSGLEFIGVYAAAGGGSMMIHGLFIAKMTEHWAMFGAVALVIVCGIIAILFRGRGIGDLLEKYKNKRKLK